MSRNELKIKKLYEIADVQLSNVDKKTAENETTVKLCNFTDVYYNWAITSNMLSNFMVATAKPTEIKKFEIKKGQVAITKDSEKRDDIGISTYIADDFKDVLLGYHCSLITPKRNVLNGKFLNAFFNSNYIKSYFSLNAGGSGQRFSLSVDTIKNTPILLPELDIQNKIGDIFSILDKKIELNNKINAELETLAKTIYDYWFVQFEFPDENGKPYKSSGGAMQYNDRLKREIPKGWEDGNLTDIANILMGQSPSGDSYNEVADGTVFFQGRTDFGERFPSIRMYTNEPSRIAQKGDILLSVRAPVGDINIASETCCIGRGLSALNSKTGHNSYLFYLMLKLRSLFDVFNGSGTTFGAINKDTLHDIKILIPKKEVLYKYEKMVSSFDKKIFDSSMENQQLTALRDWLLPMLMNGQVSVR